MGYRHIRCHRRAVVQRLGRPTKKHVIGQELK